MVNFSVEIAGNTQLDHAFRQFAARLRDFSVVWPDVAEVLREIIAETFDTEGTSGGQAWQPLTPRYAAWKRRKVGNKPIEELSGALRASLTRKNARGSVETYTATELTLGSSLRYARVQHTGNRRLPARPLLRLTESDKRRMVKAVQTLLIQEVEHGGVQVRE